MVLVNDIEFQYSVRNPQDQGGHIVYDTRGKDSQGEWEGKRRYNEFFILHEALTRRWPGVPIPAIPPKKAVGNKDMTFVQDRTFYLQRFMRKIARFEFIIESQEFLLFSRPQGMKVEQAIGKLMPLSTIARYERVKQATNTDETQYDLMQQQEFANAINEFTFFVKRIDPLFKQVKGSLARYLTSKQHCIVSY